MFRIVYKLKVGQMDLLDNSFSDWKMRVCGFIRIVEGYLVIILQWQKYIVGILIIFFKIYSKSPHELVPCYTCLPIFFNCSYRQKNMLRTWW